jgi:NAD(P)-dependent dehydrogenase (short-subunit alcohol dehydrogenase family)
MEDASMELQKKVAIVARRASGFGAAAAELDGKARRLVITDRNAENGHADGKNDPKLMGPPARRYQ